jgi:hypothetical protein
MRGFLVTVLLAAVAGLGGAACDSGGSATMGDLQVTYRIGSGSNICTVAGIWSVRVYVLDSATSTTAVRDKTVACDAADQSVLVQDLPTGNYFIRVEGRGVDDGVTYSGVTSTATTVEADRTNGPVQVIIEQIRPSLQIWFGFADVGGCDRYGVTEVRVVVYENGASSTFDQTYPCADRLGDALVIPDLSDTSTYDIRVRGLNDHAEFTYAYDQDGIVVAAGSPVTVNAVLTACSGLCTAP